MSIHDITRESEWGHSVTSGTQLRPRVTILRELEEAEDDLEGLEGLWDHDGAEWGDRLSEAADHAAKLRKELAALPDEA